MKIQFMLDTYLPLKNNDKKKRNLPPVTISQLMKNYSAYDFEIFRLSVCFY